MKFGEADMARCRGTDIMRCSARRRRRRTATAATALIACFLTCACLAQALTAVSRFYNVTTSTHFYTISPAERDHVIATYPQYVYEGPVFAAYAQPAAGTAAVNRFYNTQTGAHFYTISTDEIAYIQLTYPQFVFEGPVYYAPPDEGADGRTALYRFYNNATGAHFYTASASMERSRI